MNTTGAQFKKGHLWIGTRSHLKNRILVQDLPPGTAGQERGTEFQPADILKYFEELKLGSNTEIGAKGLFEMASN